MTGAELNETIVVGASGRVGRLLVQAWAQAGRRPTLLHRNGRLPMDLPQLPWPATEAALPRHFRSMIVLAGVVPGRGDLTDNRFVAQTCLAMAQAADIGQVLIASSSAVYGSNGGLAFRESDPLQPVNDYGRAKVVMEAACAPFRAQGMQVCALRIGNVAGADALLLNVAGGQMVTIDQFSDGAGPLRSYIGPRTMARVLGDLVGRDLPEVLNLAAPRPVAMSDLAKAAGVAWQWRPAPAGAHQRITLDCGKLRQLCSFAEADSTAAAMVDEWQSLGGAG